MVGIWVVLGDFGTKKPLVGKGWAVEISNKMNGVCRAFNFKIEKTLLINKTKLCWEGKQAFTNY